MNSRSRLRPLAIAFGLAVMACDDSSAPPSQPGLRGLEHVDATAAIVTHTYPGITYPSGIANNGFHLFVANLDGFRDIYTIDPTTNSVVATIPAGRNPRDAVFVLFDRIALSDMSEYVAVRRTFDGLMVDSIPLPWRGGGIARWRDSLYVGDIDTDSVAVVHYPSMLASPPFPVVRKFAIPVRPEGLVADTTMNVPSQATLWAITPFDSYITEFDLQGNFIRRCNTPYIPGAFGLGGVTILRDSFFIAHPTGGDPTLGTTIVRVAKSELVCDGADSIDVDPNKFPNRVNPRGGAPVKVAVLTTPSRDATTLIEATVRFGPTGTEASPFTGSILDVNGDGTLDVVYRFRVRDTDIACGDTSARLRASTTTGIPFDASDSIVTIGCRGP